MEDCVLGCTHPVYSIFRSSDSNLSLSSSLSSSASWCWIVRIGSQTFWSMLLYCDAFELLYFESFWVSYRFAAPYACPGAAGWYQQPRHRSPPKSACAASGCFVCDRVWWRVWLQVLFLQAENLYLLQVLAAKVFWRMAAWDDTVDIFSWDWTYRSQSWHSWFAFTLNMQHKGRPRVMGLRSVLDFTLVNQSKCRCMVQIQ